MNMKKATRGYVQIYTGDGKGKTTAALGLVLRALGAGLRVAMIRFLKPHAESGDKLLRKNKNFHLTVYGRAGWVDAAPALADRREAEKGLRAVERALQSGLYDCVVADELCTAVSLNALSEASVLSCLAKRPGGVELILTGRGATPGLKRAADLVTEMKAVKHYYQQGEQARPGIEY
jgi:cob(I)alamin adenosyltransferase